MARKKKENDDYGVIMDNLLDLWTGNIHVGDCIDIMKNLPQESIHMIIFSPPYWSLRDYGEGTERVWSGDDECNHEWGDDIVTRKCGKPSQSEGIFEGRNMDGIQSQAELNQGNFCQKCGAWKGQFGLEPTLNMYIEHMVKIFGEMKRVLRPDGSVYMNIGDTYNSGRSGGHAGGSNGISRPENAPNQSGVNVEGLDAKCKIFVPHRVAMAIVDDGWIARNDIVWYKPNPMPHSVKDRLNTTFEYIFHFVKNKDYYYDLDAIREPHKTSNPDDDAYRPKYRERAERGERFEGSGKYGSDAFQSFHPNGKNPGDLFQVNTKPFSDAHFAVYPPELLVKPIKSSCPPEVCAKCGKPYERVKEQTEDVIQEGGSDKSDRKRSGLLGEGKPSERLTSDGESVSQEAKKWKKFRYELRGWEKQCDCDTDETKPGVVLDPFIGSGTTAIVAEYFDRRWIGIEINEEYADMARERVNKSDWSPDKTKWRGDEKIPIDELPDVRGIGGKTMENIRKRREYLTINQLLDVEGIGEKTVERIYDEIYENDSNDSEYKEVTLDECT